MEQIDVRGLSCPQPVILTMNRMKSMGKGTFLVLTDTVTAKENITRMVLSKGWKVEAREDGDDFILTVSA